jgi:hypothetical protein
MRGVEIYEINAKAKDVFDNIERESRIQIGHIINYQKTLDEKFPTRIYTTNGVFDVDVDFSVVSKLIFNYKSNGKR